MNKLQQIQEAVDLWNKVNRGSSDFFMHAIENILEQKDVPVDDFPRVGETWENNDTGVSVKITSTSPGYVYYTLSSDTTNWHPIESFTKRYKKVDNTPKVGETWEHNYLGFVVTIAKVDDHVHYTLKEGETWDTIESFTARYHKVK